MTPDVGQMMVMLAEAYRVQLTELQVRVYVRALRDVPGDDLRRAFATAVRECKFFPSVAELRGFVTASADEAGSLAWSALSRAASRVGAYQSLLVEDGHAAMALQAVFGSWPAYCDSDAVVAQRRADFMAAYRASRREAPGLGAVRLAGLCEASGKYDASHGACWCGVVSKQGAVQAAREAPALGAGPATKRLSG